MVGPAAPSRALHFSLQLNAWLWSMEMSAGAGRMPERRQGSMDLLPALTLSGSSPQPLFVMDDMFERKTNGPTDANVPCPRLFAAAFGAHGRLAVFNNFIKIQDVDADDFNALPR